MKNIFSFFKNLFSSKTKKEELPKSILSTEKIIRSVFSPINVNLKSNKLKSNVFKPPAGLDEISVNRLDFTTPTFCKKLSRKTESVSQNRIFYGFAVLRAIEIIESNADIVYSPILLPKKEYNPFHSDIKIGYKSVKGEPLPSEFQLVVNTLTSKARFTVDSNTNSDDWIGDLK